jgi:hypothetical protein
MLHAIFFSIRYRYGTVSLNILDKHYLNTEATLLQNNEHLFRTFFFTYYQAVDEEKTSRSQIQIYGSEYRTIQTFTGGGMSKGLPLYIRNALQRQPTTHFCF